MSTTMIETSAGISRDTTERLLAQMAGMGLIRERLARNVFVCGQR